MGKLQYIPKSVDDTYGCNAAEQCRAALPSLTAGCCAITMGYRIDHRFLKTKNIPHGYTPFCKPMVLLASGLTLMVQYTDWQ